MKTNPCSITGCSKTWTRGGRTGRDGAKPLCPMHYHRERRGSAHAEIAETVHGKATTVRVHVSLPVETAQLLEVSAREGNVSQGAIVAKALDCWLATLQSPTSRKGNNR